MYLFTFLSTVYKGFLYSTSLPAFVIFYHFDNRHLDRCEMISHFVFEFPLKISRFPGISVGENPPSVQEMQETWIWFLGWVDPLKEEIATHSSILAWENYHGWRGLMGYSPWGCKESGLFHVSTGHLYVLLIQFLCPYFVVGLFCCGFFFEL